MRLGRLASTLDAGLAPRVVVGHSGKQHAYRLALALQRTGALRAFLTTSYYKPAEFPDRLLGRAARVDAFLRRRYLADLDPARVVRRWGLEAPELVARALFRKTGLPDKLVCWRDAAFDRWAARTWAHKADVYWGFQGSCLFSMKAARRAGAVAVAEFATAHVTRAVRLLSREAERHPEWADSISNLYFPDWYRERLEREPHVADWCLAASEFTRQSLLEVGVAPEKVKLLPLGADLANFRRVERPAEGPFRILFVGGVGQRKGVKYLLEAYQQMRGAGTELVIAGPLMGSGRALEQFRGLYTYLGRLDQKDVIREMQRCHVLVLPSVFEGFGLVIPEAMATAMPVIASTHTAGPEIIREGEDGFVLAPDDVSGLAARLAWLAEHRANTADMGRAAAERAQAFSWDAHTERVRTLLNELTEPTLVG
jgi:alpha-maltose-1-phosphate synthase